MSTIAAQSPAGPCFFSRGPWHIIEVIALLCAMCAIALSPCWASAATHEVEIVIESTTAPTHAIGMIITPKSIIERPLTNIRQYGDHQFVASFSVQSGTHELGSVATALFVLPNGTLTLGPTHELDQPVSSASALHLPNCPVDLGNSLAVQGKAALLETLVSIRDKRRTNAKAIVNHLMQGELLQRIKKLEDGFGISVGRANALSPEMRPLELLDRLSRLVAALDRYKQSKQ